MPRISSPLTSLLRERVDRKDAHETWFRLAGRRIAAQWAFKTVGSMAFMMAFFAGYFLLLKYPAFEPTTMPTLALDRRIPFSPVALGLYVSLWLYVEIPVALLVTRAELIRYGRSLSALALIGFAVFFLWPTRLASSHIDPSQHPAFGILQSLDASGNACPSLHVAFAAFSALSIERSLKTIRAPFVIHIVNTLWCLGITYSTIATRQHVSIDVLAGAALALLIHVWSGRQERTATSFNYSRSERRAAS